MRGPTGKVISVPVPVVLASASPARKRLLRQVVDDFRVVWPHVFEEHFPGESSRDATLRLAREKARDVAGRRGDALIIAADTLVVCESEVIGKPADRADAVRILKKLTGSPHCVVTGLHVIAPDGRERSACAETRLRMRHMSRAELEDYVNRPGALDRAGVYGLEQDDPNVAQIEGSPSTVMGLPLAELRGILSELYPQDGVLR